VTGKLVETLLAAYRRQGTPPPGWLDAFRKSNRRFGPTMPSSATEGLTDAAYTEILGRAARRQEQNAGITLDDLHQVADKPPGLRPEHVVGAINDILSERGSKRDPAISGVWPMLLRAGGHFCVGLGFAGAIVWHAAVQGLPVSLLVNLAALWLVWVGGRLTAGRSGR